MNKEPENLYCRYKTNMITFITESLKDETTTESDIKRRIARMNRVASRSILPDFQTIVFSYRLKCSGK